MCFGGRERGRLRAALTSLSPAHRPRSKHALDKIGAPLQAPSVSPERVCAAPEGTSGTMKQTNELMCVGSVAHRRSFPTPTAALSSGVAALILAAANVCHAGFTFSPYSCAACPTMTNVSFTWDTRELPADPNAPPGAWNYIKMGSAHQTPGHGELLRQVSGVRRRNDHPYSHRIPRHALGLRHPDGPADGCNARTVPLLCRSFAERGGAPSRAPGLLRFVCAVQWDYR